MKRVEAVFLWAIGVLLIYGAIAVFYYGGYVLFWGGPLVEVYIGEPRQILSFGPGLAWMILSVTMVFAGKAVLTRKTEIKKELTDEKHRREKETLKSKLAPHHADVNREKLWEDRFDENDREIDFETIDFLLEPTSGNRANSFGEDESKFAIETIDLSLDLLSMDRVNGFDEDDTDLDLALTNQTPEYKSAGPKKYREEDDTDLEYPKEV